MKSRLVMMSSVAAIVVAASAFPAAAQYRRATVQPPMDQTRILSQGTAVQVPLVMLADSRRTVGKAKVEDKDGHTIGSVENIATDPSGRPNAVKIGIGGTLGMGRKYVQLDARAFLFEQDRDILIANLTGDELKALPSVNGT